jgi:hypothetical protein
MRGSKPRPNKKYVRSGEGRASELVISGDKTFGAGHASCKQTITLKLSENFIVIYVKNHPAREPKRFDLYINIFSRKDGSIWVGDSVQHSGNIKGNVVYKWDDSYVCIVNSMRGYLGDLFLIRPNDLRLFDVISEVNSHRGSISESLHKIFTKILKD